MEMEQIELIPRTSRAKRLTVGILWTAALNAERHWRWSRDPMDAREVDLVEQIDFPVILIVRGA